jgi:hypothetical protein
LIGAHVQFVRHPIIATPQAQQLEADISTGLSRLSDEEARIVAARAEVATLRSAEVAKGEQERAALVAAARTEAAALLAEVQVKEAARIADEAAFTANVANREAVLQAKLATMQRDAQEKLQVKEANIARREDAFQAKLEKEEQSTQDRIRQHEADVTKRLSTLRETHAKSLAQSTQAFEEGCRAKEARLAEMAATEVVVQKRAAEMAAAGTKFVDIKVGGALFCASTASIARHPQSLLAVEVHSHLQQGNSGSGDQVCVIDGSPVHFQLILDYLRRNTLPVVADVSQLQWLESEVRITAPTFCLFLVLLNFS